MAKANAKQSRLGTTQYAVLTALVRHGEWFEGRGWVWDTPSGTRRVLDSLVRAGLVVTEDEYRIGATRTVYRPTLQAQHQVPR